MGKGEAAWPAACPSHCPVLLFHILVVMCKWHQDLKLGKALNCSKKKKPNPCIQVPDSCTAAFTAPTAGGISASVTRMVLAARWSLQHQGHMCQHGVVGVRGSMAGASSIQLLAALAPSAAAGTPSPVISQPTSAVPCHRGKEALVRMLPGITPLRALPSVLCGD